MPMPMPMPMLMPMPTLVVATIEILQRLQFQIQDCDVAKAITEFVAQVAIEKLVLGAPAKSGFMRRFKSPDLSTHITKGAPDFCTVVIISKGKVLGMRNAVRSAPTTSPLRAQIQNSMSLKPPLNVDSMTPRRSLLTPKAQSEPGKESYNLRHNDSIRSPFTRGLRGYTAKSYAEISTSSDTDISFVSSGGRVSFEQALPPRLSNGSDGLDRSFESVPTPLKSVDYSTGNEFSYASQASTATSSSSQMEEVEEEMKRLRLELKHTMDMYNNACKEANTANQKARELQKWKIEEEKKVHEVNVAEEAAEREKTRYKAMEEAGQAENRIAELEARKRVTAEMKAIKESSERDSIGPMRHDLRYRKYTINEIEVATEYFTDRRKIGEGGYGPVYKCHLDHTAVAVKVLRPDAAQGRSQFHQEIEVLSCIRHPHMVLLLGACPEYGCIVYEYMANGSLEDRLFRRGNTPAIPWQYRFRIAAEIATALLFLHRMKPEPLVHRDLKPANILLDRNYVSKIGDVGLARLVPPSVADSVTQYRVTSTAGTFCYIDPEYQQTGMLGVKSDIYSLGVMLLQIITAKPPMGLTHHVSRAIERGELESMLDPEVADWPVHEAQRYAEIALKCTELRRKDRPDLEKVVLPELNRLRALGDCNFVFFPIRTPMDGSPGCQISHQDAMSDPLMGQERHGFNGYANMSS
ncbi:U-box domain-containing protein 52-like [Zingiber officinale]|uniref:U-box domain-containing protein 52-like n=1 Tax=Zingiber officinale TaxID=94328 RepID=UPI001C4AAA0D|nr:U-box domain-containing protein 52-like [Zingiber officinale]